MCACLSWDSCIKRSQACSSAGISRTDVQKVGGPWLVACWTCMARLRGVVAHRRGVPGRADARGAAAQHGRPGRCGRRPGGRGAPPLLCWHAVPNTCMESYTVGGRRARARRRAPSATLAGFAMHLRSAHIYMSCLALHALGRGRQDLGGCVRKTLSCLVTITMMPWERCGAA